MTKENRWFVIIAVVFAIGIIMGCIYCALIKDGAELYVFLQEFIASIKDGTDKTLIFKKTFISGMKIICLFFMCAMMNYGFVPICGITAVKSFSIGFTFAALFKYFGKNGILLIMSQLSSNLLLFIIVVLFGAVCAGVGLARKGKGIFVKLTAAFFVSCIGVVMSAFAAGYVDVYILNFIAERLY